MYGNSIGKFNGFVLKLHLKEEGSKDGSKAQHQSSRDCRAGKRIVCGRCTKIAAEARLTIALVLDAIGIGIADTVTRTGDSLTRAREGVGTQDAVKVGLAGALEGVAFETTGTVTAAFLTITGIQLASSAFVASGTGACVRRA